MSIPLSSYIKPTLKIIAILLSCLPLVANGLEYAVVDDLDQNVVPPGLGACQYRGPQASIGEVIISRSLPEVLNISDVKNECGTANECVIGKNVTVHVDEPLEVYSLTVRDGGTVQWNDNTQANQQNWLCAGYVVVEDGGRWEMELNKPKMAWIYLKDNGAVHPNLGVRVFGSYANHEHEGMPGGMSMSDAATPYLQVRGHELGRTWSLLGEGLRVQDYVQAGTLPQMKLIHDVSAMGWQAGDRLAIAPNDNDTAQTFFIDSSAQNTVTARLAPDSQQSDAAYLFESVWAGEAGGALLSPEVINLSRNIVITGDGSLHTVAAGHGGFTEIANTRVEKCGQEGVLGKYCMHFHHKMDCATRDANDEITGSSCIFRNNAVEYSEQVGITVHQTHNSVVENNVFYDVHGTNIYIEAGNEMNNTVAYNVGICPRKGHCEVSNSGLNSADNVGLYMVNPSNTLVGNRMSNFDQGMITDAGSSNDFRRDDLCANHVPFGLWLGNTFHGNDRFGTYPHSNYPRANTGQSLATNGLSTSECDPYDYLGNDMGLKAQITGHLDVGNVYVGQYPSGDIQYKQHINIDNNNAPYWKETKTFGDMCSAHISESYFKDNSAALPDAMGAFIIEDTVFENYRLNANHHCGVGGNTGYMCMPQYVLHNVTAYGGGNNTWMKLDQNNNNDQFGGIFTLSPDNINGIGESPGVFPEGYVSMAGKPFTYLTELDGGATSPADKSCELASQLGFGSQFDAGILCKSLLTPLKLWVPKNDFGSYQNVDLILRVFSNAQSGNTLLAQQQVPFFDTGNYGGYTLPVISGDDYRYEISLSNGSDIPANWIIDFGDLAVSKRWGVEHLKLTVAGRECENDTIYSNHDRRFYASGHDFNNPKIWGDADSGFIARGACNSFVEPMWDRNDSDFNCDAATAGIEKPVNLDERVFSEWVDKLDTACANTCSGDEVCATRYLGASTVIEPVPVSSEYQCISKPNLSLKSFARSSGGGNDPVTNESSLIPSGAVELDRSGWVLSASNNEGALQNAIDGNAGSRWDSSTAQRPGQWITIDLGSPQAVSGIVLNADNSGNDYPRGYEISVPSTEGGAFDTVIASGQGNAASMVISFASVTTQRLRIQLTASVDPYWWSVHELRLFNSGSSQPAPEPEPEPIPSDRITAMQLVNSDTNSIILALSDGATLGQSVVGTALNLVAETEGTIDRVQFNYGDSLQYSRTERAAPYTLGGDGNGNYNATPYLQTLGSKRIRATALSRDGTELHSLELTFTIVEQVSNQASLRRRKPAKNPELLELADPDTDGDGLTDVEEDRYGTDPHDPDTDDDGVSDGDEVAAGTDALVADVDGDGFPDIGDACIHSIVSTTVSIKDVDSGVANTVDALGCSVADKLDLACSGDFRNHEQFVSCVAQTSSDLRTAGVINKNERLALVTAAGKDTGH